MSELVQTTFDYSALTEQEADVAKRSADIIKLRMRRTAEDIVEIGRELKAVKEALPHGKFLPWIEAEFGMTQRTAQNFMQVSEKFKCETVSHFGPKVLYLLSAPSTPEPVIAQATAKAATGETVTVKDVQEWKAKAAQAEKLLRMSEEQRIEAERALKAEKEKPPAVKEIVKEVVPSDYQKLKDDQAALAKALQDAKTALSKVRSEQDTLVKDQVRARMADYQGEVDKLEKKRQSLESSIKNMESQRAKLDSRLSTEKYYDDLIKKFTNFLVELSVDLSEFDELPERFGKWEGLAVQLENGAKAIRHMIGKEA